jgi:hypothetical protein
MPLTVEQIVEVTRHWPPAHLAEIQDGVEQPVDGDEVSAEVRRIVGR